MSLRGVRAERVGDRPEERFTRPVSPETLPASKVRPADRGFSVSTREEERGAVIAPAGEFDGSALSAFEDAITPLIDEGRPIVLDLRALTFIDSSGLWAITLTQRLCRERGIGLAIEPGPRRVQSVFEVTGLADLLPFVPARAAV
jgi:anti-anti-sigma factor